MNHSLKMEDLPDHPLIPGIRYVFYAKSKEDPILYNFPSSPTISAVFIEYYHNSVGYCMQRFRDVVHCHSYDPFDLYNPDVAQITLLTDYSCVRVMEMRYHCIPIHRFHDTEKREIAKRAYLRDRRQVELALTSSVLPRELVRYIANFLCYKIIPMVPNGSKS